MGDIPARDSSPGRRDSLYNETPIDAKRRPLDI